MTTGWTLFIVIITAINVVGATWLMWASSRRGPGEPAPGTETTGHTWDGDLREFNNPLPRWWLWLFYGTVAFSIAYMVLFPGLGSFKGTLGWTQEGQWKEQVEAAERAAAPMFERFAAMSIGELGADTDAMRVARNLYANNCATCHGSDARGAAGFPNLTNADWQWGGSEDAVYATIAHGRLGAMPPWGEMLGQQGVEEVVAYVLTLSGQSAPADLAAAGKTRFEAVCAACHGPDGKGMQAVGAPNLTDDVWVYGPGADMIRYAVVNGRQNQMPAHLDLLGEQRVRLLTAYVLTLAPPQPAPEPAPVPAEAAPAEGAGEDAAGTPAADAGGTVADAPG
jgi:cytochrome c oxidase cbb3-type subunit 3